MPYAQWSDSLSIGVKAIDDQHKQLVQMLNDLCDAFDSPDRENVVATCLSKMKKYSQEHFTDEEQLVKDNNYPEIEAHIKEHEIFIEKVSAYKAAQIEQYLPFQDMLEFLKSWLVEHITESDQKIAAFLKR